MKDQGRPLSVQGRSITGPGAGAVKYDILTALLTLAAQGDASDARLALRLSLIITARYNWRSLRFAVGQRELARMWGVTERTAKRDMAALKAKGWIRVTVPAARGRVAEHTIEMSRLLPDTMALWGAVGPDFEARMIGLEPAEAATTNVVPMMAKSDSTPIEQTTIWGQAGTLLAAQDPGVFQAWFAPLVTAEEGPQELALMAPSAFAARYIETHYATRVLAMVRQVAPEIRAVRVIAPDR